MPKKPIIILTVAFLIFLMVIFFLLSIKNLSKSPDEAKKGEGSVGTLISPTEIVASPTAGYSGADTEGNEQYLKENPHLLIESRLKTKVPLVYENFTLDYSYKEDKFTVKLKPPYPQARAAFDLWMKQVGLSDQNRFIFVE